LEYKQEIVHSKTLVHLTTNGTRALKSSENAAYVCTASFANLSAAAERLQGLNHNIDTILGIVSGREGHYCIEDTVCLGGVFTYMFGPPGGAVNMTDAARTAVDLFQLYRGNILTMLQQSDHGHYLESIGLGDDLPICAEIDNVLVVPTMHDGVISI
jgi:2-phosphosulfolactate phosphatase